MSTTHTIEGHPDTLDQVRLATDVWWPVRKQQRALLELLSGPIEDAFRTFQQRVTQSGLKEVDPIWPTLAHSLAQGYLKDRLQRKIDSGLVAFAKSRETDRLAELMLVAACHQKNSQANQAILNLIDDQVRPQLVQKWGPIGIDAVQDLPSKMLFLSKSGYGRGLPRLLEFSGGCQLSGWLKTCASNYANDLLRRQHATQFPEHGDQPLIDPPNAASEDRPAENELTNRLREVLPGVIAKLRNDLKAAPQQLSYLNLMMIGKSRSEILELMTISASRAVELSQLVCGKLLNHLSNSGLSSDHQSSSTDQSRISTAQRTLIETALRELFGSSTESTEGVQ